MRAAHGLIVGKFYPPHSGHHSLIDTAASVCDAVTVVVAASDVETIAVELRTEWIRVRHEDQPNVHVVTCVDNHPIDYDDPGIWDLHMAAFHEALRMSPARHAVDAVFSNELYGNDLAARLNAVAVDTGLVGQSRLSASAIRADPVGHWEDLEPAVRAWFTKRIVVVGAESTGTTSVAKALCDRYRQRGGAFGLTQWVPEYGRELTARKLANLRAERMLRGEKVPAMEDLVWTDEDFVDVACTQNAWEDQAAIGSGPVLFCDTDSWATGIWQERYMGRCTPEVEELRRREGRALYLLTDHVSVPFVQDGLRDGEQIRSAMTERFVEAFAEEAWPYVVLDAESLDGRVEQAVEAVDDVVASGWQLGIPLEYQS